MEGLCGDVCERFLRLVRKDEEKEEEEEKS